jgi:hypothetical protein
MKKQASNATSSGLSKPKIKRSGIHSKKKHSASKRSKNYKKKYRGQGR